MPTYIKTEIQLTTLYLLIIKHLNTMLYLNQRHTFSLKVLVHSLFIAYHQLAETYYVAENEKL